MKGTVLICAKNLHNEWNLTETIEPIETPQATDSTDKTGKHSQNQAAVKTGPVTFEFQRHGMSAEEFVGKLDSFFSQLPKDFRYAAEIRNAGLLGPLYRDMLAQQGVAHVYNHWSYMPPLAEQHKRIESFTAPFTVLRLLTPLKMSYEAAKKRAEPYNKIVGELAEMRNDTVGLIKQAVAEHRQAYVLVNNRSEGCAPLTVQALVETMRE